MSLSAVNTEMRPPCKKFRLRTDLCACTMSVCAVRLSKKRHIGRLFAYVGATHATCPPTSAAVSAIVPARVLLPQRRPQAIILMRAVAVAMLS